MPAPFWRVGNRYINPANVTDVEVFPERKPGYDYEEGERITPSPLTVEIHTTGVDSRYVEGGDYPVRARVEPTDRVITLSGGPAESFIRGCLQGDVPEPIRPPDGYPCAVCRAGITSGELCAKCAEGNDPYPEDEYPNDECPYALDDFNYDVYRERGRF